MGLQNRVGLVCKILRMSFHCLEYTLGTLSIFISFIYSASSMFTALALEIKQIKIETNLYIF